MDCQKHILVQTSIPENATGSLSQSRQMPQLMSQGKLVDTICYCLLLLVDKYCNKAATKMIKE